MMRRSIGAVLLCALWAPLSPQAQSPSPFAVAAPPPPSFDRTAAQHDAQKHLEDLIRIDTQNPPGNEMRTARYFESVLSGIPGIDVRVLDAGSGRANFIARLHAARATRRPVIVMGHMDVVGADTRKWITPPFEPNVRENYLYSRGAIDDKGMLAATIAAIIQLAPSRASLDRDVILLATAAEEGGGGIGIERIVSERLDAIKDAEFALNEGRIRLGDHGVQTVNIQVTEKISYNVILTATGTGGHGSVPLPDNALAALSRAAARLHEWKAPVRLNSTTRVYFSRLAAIETNPDMKRAMEIVGSSTDPAEIDRAAAILSKEPLHNAVLRTAQSLTMINGGFRSNVIPSEGMATFNVRALPDDDIGHVVEEMKRVTAERQVRVELEGQPKTSPPVSPTTTDLFRAMENAARTMAPQAVIVPFMSTGATDGATLRAKGIPTYGILPMPLPLEDELRMHGDNERVPLPALGWATEYLYRVLQLTATSGKASQALH